MIENVYYGYRRIPPPPMVSNSGRIGNTNKECCDILFEKCVWAERFAYFPRKICGEWIWWKTYYERGHLWGKQMTINILDVAVSPTIVSDSKSMHTITPPPKKP